MAKKTEKANEISDFNLEKISTEMFEKHLDYAIQLGTNVFVCGKRGSGKTEMAYQASHRNDMNLVYFNASTMDRVDCAGFPNMLEKTKYVDYRLPKDFEPLIEGSKPCVLLLDEIDKAPQELQHPFLQISQAKCIGGHALPNLRMVIMTANLISEGSQRPSLPLLDRCEKYMLNADIKGFFAWSAREGNIHPAIAAYLNDNPDSLHPPEETDDLYATPSPRSWHRYSNQLHRAEQLNLDKDIMIQKAFGNVGKVAGMEFKNYYEYFRGITPIVDIIYDVQNKQPVSQAIAMLNQLKTQSEKIVASIFAASRFNRLMTEALERKNKSPLVQLPNGQKGRAYDELGKIILKRSSEFFNKIGPDECMMAFRSQVGFHKMIDLELFQDPDWKNVISQVSQRVGFTHKA